MALSGTRAATLRATVLAALSGQSLTGLTYLTVTLTPSSDPLDVLTPTGALECQDGALVVLVRSQTTQAATPQTTGGRVQRWWQHTLTVRWAVAVLGLDGHKVSDDLQRVTDAVIDLVEAALEPQSGANLNVVSGAFGPPTRRGDFLIYEVTYACREPWARA